MKLISKIKLSRNVAALFSMILVAASMAPTKADVSTNYYNWALTPPMGWNSYDAFGDSVTEAEVLANAQYLKDKLATHGWQYVVVDYRWYDPGAHDNNPNGRKGVALTMDQYGRLLPSPNRFPSAADGAGFKPLADKIHAMGLKFGIHVMRGIPRLAVKANMPIEGSDFHAWDASSFSLCPWNPDMFGVDAKEPAGRAYYDSILRLYASWGVDFIKVDDLSRPYSKDEIEAIRQAIDKCGRPIVFSTSPGETARSEALHIATHANMWRMSDDFWDNWKSLNHAFDLDYAWQGIGGPGHWPDSDMIPLGRIGIRSVGGDRRTHFTHDEQVTLVSMWCLAPSPLMLGMNLPDNDNWTLSLLTNDEALAINQDPLGKPARRVSKTGGAEVWVKELKDGSLAVGLFNRGRATTDATLTWSDAGLTGKQTVHDVWSHKDVGVFENQLTQSVPSHGSVLWRVQAAK
jgi:alpha-galactosidase